VHDFIYPLHKLDGSRYDAVLLKTGTIVKLYNFRVGEKFKNFRGAREAFNENLIETILPFRIMDFRFYKDETKNGLVEPDVRPFYGMEYILRRHHADDEEQPAQPQSTSTAARMQVGELQDPDLGTISITAVPLDRDIPGWLKGSKNRVFHAVNG